MEFVYAGRISTSGPVSPRTLDWANALLSLGIEELEQDIIETTLSCILKYKQDQEKT